MRYLIIKKKYKQLNNYYINNKSLKLWNNFISNFFCSGRVKLLVLIFLMNLNNKTLNYLFFRDILTKKFLWKHNDSFYVFNEQDVFDNAENLFLKKESIYYIIQLDRDDKKNQYDSKFKRKFYIEKDYRYININDWELKNYFVKYNINYFKNRKIKDKFLQPFLNYYINGYYEETKNIFIKIFKNKYYYKYLLFGNFNKSWFTFFFKNSFFPFYNNINKKKELLDNFEILIFDEIFDRFVSISDFKKLTSSWLEKNVVNWYNFFFKTRLNLKLYKFKFIFDLKMKAYGIWFWKSDNKILNDGGVTTTYAEVANNKPHLLLSKNLKYYLFNWFNWRSTEVYDITDKLAISLENSGDNPVVSWYKNVKIKFNRSTASKYYREDGDPEFNNSEIDYEHEAKKMLYLGIFENLLAIFHQQFYTLIDVWVERYYEYLKYNTLLYSNIQYLYNDIFLNFYNLVENAIIYFNLFEEFDKVRDICFEINFFFQISCFAFIFIVCLWLVDGKIGFLYLCFNRKIIYMRKLPIFVTIRRMWYLWIGWTALYDKLDFFDKEDSKENLDREKLNDVDITLFKDIKYSLTNEEMLSPHENILSDLYDDYSLLEIKKKVPIPTDPEIASKIIEEYLEIIKFFGGCTQYYDPDEIAEAVCENKWKEIYGGVLDYSWENYKEKLAGMAPSVNAEKVKYYWNKKDSTLSIFSKNKEEFNYSNKTYDSLTFNTDSGRYNVLELRPLTKLEQNILKSLTKEEQSIINTLENLHVKEESLLKSVKWNVAGAGMDNFDIIQSMINLRKFYADFIDKKRVYILLKNNKYEYQNGHPFSLRLKEAIMYRNLEFLSKTEDVLFDVESSTKIYKKYMEQGEYLKDLVKKETKNLSGLTDNDKTYYITKKWEKLVIEKDFDTSFYKHFSKNIFRRAYRKSKQFFKYFINY